MKNSFLMYAEYEQYFDMLTPFEQSNLLKSLFRAFKGEDMEQIIDELDGMTKMAFAFMKNQMEIDSRKYEQKCETNRANGSGNKRPLPTATEEEQDEATAPDGIRTPPYKDKDIDIDIDLKKEINKEKKENTVLTDSELEALINESFTDKRVKAKFIDYRDMRAAMGKNKAIRTRATFELCVTKLRKFAKTSEEAIEILGNSIANNWTGLFALKKERGKEGDIPYAN